MSGSSLDGLDIAYCTFQYTNDWKFEIIKAKTVEYPEEWLLNLREAAAMSALELTYLDMEYGKFIGEQTSELIRLEKITPDLISSHGHTIFHEPERGFTLQIGNGQAIANLTGIRTVYDFRTEDILNGGQGAPLVPIGDEFLFSSYDFCLNIGGIANISYNDGNNRIGYDICPANQLLNYLSLQLGKPYDENGSIAALGKLNKQLFNRLNDHPYYKMNYPKSMSNQLVSESFIPIIDQSDAPIEDCLYTVCKHIAYQINNSIKRTGSSLIITGGGAHNHFLTKAIEMETLCRVIIPESKIIDYKESLIFGFMGLLRNLGVSNCLASATGAKRNSIAGIIAG